MTAAGVAVNTAVGAAGGDVWLGVAEGGALGVAEGAGEAVRVARAWVAEGVLLGAAVDDGRAVADGAAGEGAGVVGAGATGAEGDTAA